MNKNKTKDKKKKKQPAKGAFFDTWMQMWLYMQGRLFFYCSPQTLGNNLLTLGKNFKFWKKKFKAIILDMNKNKMKNKDIKKNCREAFVAFCILKGGGKSPSVYIDGREFIGSEVLHFGKMLGKDALWGRKLDCFSMWSRIAKYLGGPCVEGYSIEMYLEAKRNFNSFPMWVFISCPISTINSYQEAWLTQMTSTNPHKQLL